jgi:enoyl-CoA hydratase/carnithine racemase
MAPGRYASTSDNVNRHRPGPVRKRPAGIRLQSPGMQAADDTVLLDIADGIATITLNRPAVLNALTPDMLVRLGAVISEAASDPGAGVIVLTGAGRGFSAGVDLKALGDRSLDGGSVGDILDVPAREAIRLLTTVPKVVIAKVNGACFTGALELALACDLIVVADQAKIGDTHAKWGLRPTWGMSQRLVRAVGITRARELSYTARTFTGEDAARWGLAAQSVPGEALDQTVADLAAEIIANSAGSLAAYKDLFRRSLDAGLGDGLDYEAGAAYRIADTEERVSSFR